LDISSGVEISKIYTQVFSVSCKNNIIHNFSGKVNIYLFKLFRGHSLNVIVGVKDKVNTVCLLVSISNAFFRLIYT
jgi:hypothetical protein